MNRLEEYRSMRLDVLAMLVRPIVRFCLRRSHSVQDLIHVAKLAFIELAAEEIERANKKVNMSRLSVVTGLHRRDVAKIFSERKPASEDRLSLVERVIGQWRHDKRFALGGGQSKTLSFKGENNEFQQLVRTVSTAIKPGTILFELERMGAVKKTSRGLTLVLELGGFANFPRKGFEVLATDIDTLIQAAEENLLVEKQEKGISNLHLHTEYDNVFRKDLPKIRKWLVTEGKVFHKRAREFISQFDKDINPDHEGQVAGQRVVIGTFALTPPLGELAPEALELLHSETPKASDEER